MPDSTQPIDTDATIAAVISSSQLDVLLYDVEQYKLRSATNPDDSGDEWLPFPTQDVVDAARRVDTYLPRDTEQLRTDIGQVLELLADPGSSVSTKLTKAERTQIWTLLEGIIDAANTEQQDALQFAGGNPESIERVIAAHKETRQAARALAEVYEGAPSASELSELIADPTVSARRRYWAVRGVSTQEDIAELSKEGFGRAWVDQERMVLYAYAANPRRFIASAVDTSPRRIANAVGRLGNGMHNFAEGFGQGLIENPAVVTPDGVSYLGLAEDQSESTPSVPERRVYEPRRTNIGEVVALFDLPDRYITDYVARDDTHPGVHAAVLRPESLS